MKPELEAYIAARKTHDEAKRAKSAAAQAEQEAMDALVEAMVQDETQSIKLDDGTTFYLTRRPRFKLNEGNNDMVREWLRETTGDDHEFVETKVVRKRLSDHLKTLLEEQAVEEADLPDFLDYSFDPEIAVRGWAQHTKSEAT